MDQVKNLRYLWNEKGSFRQETAHAKPLPHALAQKSERGAVHLLAPPRTRPTSQGGALPEPIPESVAV